MYRFSGWKLFFIAIVVLFSIIYLLPTPERIYEPLYGNLPLYMQEKLPKLEVTEKSELKMELSGNLKLPEGISFKNLTDQLSETFRRELAENGFKEKQDYQIEIREKGEFAVKFLSDRTESELETIADNLRLYGKLPFMLRRLLPSERLKLGLDLKGGVHLVLEVDIEESKGALLKAKRNIIPELLRAEKIHCRKVGLLEKRSALRAVVNVPKRLAENPEKRSAYLEKAKKVLSELQYFDDAVEVDKPNANSHIYEIVLGATGATEYSEQAIDQVLTVLRNRVDAFGVSEPSIRRDANRPRIIVELPGAKDSSGPLKIVETMGQLEFKLVAKDRDGNLWIGSADTPPPDNLPDDLELREKYEEGGWYVLKSRQLLTGEHISDAYPTTGQIGIDRVVSLSFDARGRRTFAEVTSDNVNENLAILLDGKVQSAPTIREPIPSGNAQISGDFTFDEARYLANILKSGAFPVGVKIAEERTVGPTLGQESIEKGFLAGVIGMGIVLVFMAIYYKFSGLIAIIALSLNMLIVLGGLAGFGAALTLPGLAGLVLTIGMAVDANVLIFERIREELRTGKAVWQSIDNGYKRAFWTILDANLTTLAVAIVLYNFGTGPIKGFAVTLAIGIMASMFTAIVVTHEVFRWIFGNREMENLSI